MLEDNSKIEVETEDAARTPFRQAAPGMFRTKLIVSYDGADFCGWQRQTRHKSVQGSLEAALSKIYDRPITVLGASRTDSGVHATGQVAHFDAPKDPSLFDLRYALIRLTPPTIVVRDVFLAPPHFHSIANSVKKTYRYMVLNRVTPSALRYRYTHWVRFPLDLNYLNEASKYLIGRQDFKSFQTSGGDVKTTTREIHHAEWIQKDHDTLEFVIQGNGFLKQMVRNIVGTLLDMNQNGDAPEKLKEIIAALDRRKAGATAPPQGLYLSQVYYPSELDRKCRKL